MCVMVLVWAIGLHYSTSAQQNSKSVAPDPFAISREDAVKVFEKLWDTTDKRYFDPKFNGVDWAQMKEKYRPEVESAKTRNQLVVVLQRMLGELHTSHLAVTVNTKVTQERISEYVARKVERNESLLYDPGMRLKRVEGQNVVESVIDGSGAQLAGVQRGWILTKWNGQTYDASQFNLVELDEKIQLQFTDSLGSEKNLDVICRLYPLARQSTNRSSRMLADGALYLRFAEFAGGTNDWLEAEVSKNLNAPAIVIDLRGNGGGLITVLRRCFEPFFSEPKTFGEFHERNGKEPALKTSGRGKSAYDGRIIVLIDEKSASSAEMFAAGLQESGRATVVGRQSSGEVLAKYVQGLPNGFKASIAIRDYLTAKGVRLEGRGVTPDEPVKLTMKDFLENHDSDLDQVSQLLKKTN